MAGLPSRVLVTGASGRLGRRLVAHLTELGVASTGLVLPTVDSPAADRVVVGNAANPADVARALSDVDAVVHLAAIPAPNLGTGHDVFGGNTLATFVVLEQAALAGVRRAVIASSFSATGLPFSPVPARPAYLPVDEDLPSTVADPYGLSKEVDELTAAMAARRYGMSVVALRFPFLGEPELRLPKRARRCAETPEAIVPELWSYLDDRDAARVCVAALTVAPPGCHVVGVAAPLTLSPYPTEALLDRFLPEVPRRRAFPGRMSLVDTTRARALLGFEAQHLYPIDERSLP
jgi:nucleoside-diphosphate-sugar epimerase